MRKLLLCTCFFPILAATYGQPDTLVWGSRPLKWTDFKGKWDTAVVNRQHLATTLWQLHYEYKPLPAKGEVLFVVYAWFNGNRSWVKPRSRNDDSLLRHEQGHFDLAELLARRLRKQLSQTNFSVANYAFAITTIANQLIIENNALQVRYDRETQYGEQTNRQQYWQSFIATELNELRAYASSYVTAKLQ